MTYTLEDLLKDLCDDFCGVHHNELEEIKRNVLETNKKRNDN
jgi:hypothetical protein